MPLQVVVEGIVDKNPPNTANSYIQDADPTFGLLDFVLVGYILKMTTGAAVGNTYIVTNIKLDKNRIKVAENLFTEGVLLGDKYIVYYQTEDYVDVEDLDNAILKHGFPDSSFIWQKLRSKLSLVENILRGAYILYGLIDSFVTTTITDSDPIDGNISNDIENNHTLEITNSVTGETKRGRISGFTATDITTSLDVDAAGIIPGDEYRVIHGLEASQISGHTHNGIDSRTINIDDIEAVSLFGGF